MKKHAFLIASVMLAATSFSVSAQAVKVNPGVYLGVDGGFASVPSLTSPAGARVTSETKSAGFMRGALGYHFTSDWALELGYFGTGDFKQSGMVGTGRYDAKYKASGADFTAIYKFKEGLPGLFLKAGVSYARVSGSGIRFSDGSQSASGMGYLLGLGYEYDFSSNWGANLAYTRYQRVGSVENLNANVLTAGLKYRF